LSFDHGKSRSSPVLPLEIEHGCIFDPAQTTILDIDNIDRRFAGPEALNYTCVEIFIRQIADIYACFKAIWRRAVSSLEKSSGFA
jgi:hypothetical protein